MPKKKLQFMVEDAEVIFKNFTGRVTPFNRDGTKKFCVFLPQEQAQAMLEDDWNVRYLEPTEEGDVPRPIIEVKINFGIRPPRIVTLTDSGSRNNLNESNVEILDSLDIRSVDLIANAYAWDFNGKTGITAYLQSLYVTIEEDALSRKYEEHFENE